MTRTDGSGRASVAATLIVVLTVAGAPVAAEPDAEPFTVRLVSHTSAVLDEVGAGRGWDVSVGVRGVGPFDPDAFAGLEGRAGEVVVDRYSFRWVSHDRFPPVLKPGYAPLQSQPETTSTTYRDARLHYAPAAKGAVLVVRTAQADLDGTEQTHRVASVVSYPNLARHSSSTTEDGGPPEFHLWSLEGEYVKLVPGRLRLHARGDVEVYWNAGTVALSTPEGETALESGVSDEVDGADRVRVHRSVWFHARLREANLRFDVAGDGPGVSVEAYAKRVELGAGAVSLDSHTHLNGSLPESSRRTGPSLWIAGALQTNWVPVASPSGTPAPSYEVVVSGQATAYALGGEPTVYLSTSVAAVAATGGAFLLLGAVVLFWERLVDALGRFVPGYAKVRPERLLDLEARRRIVGVVAGEPGVSLRVLQARLGDVGWGGLVRHVRRLERHGHLVRVHAGRFVRFFPAGTADVVAAREALVRTGPVPRILVAVRASPGLSQSELHRSLEGDLGTTRQAFEYHLRRLEAHGLVRRSRRGVTRCVYPTRLMEEVEVLRPVPVVAPEAGKPPA